MNHTELRIGNYVAGWTRTIPSGELQIVTLGFDSAHVVPINQIPAQVEEWPLFKYTAIEPIRITEGWLLRFGWVWNQECNSYEKYPDGDARMHLAKKSMGGYDMFNYVLKATICQNIHYVHQLQNLYFALTGKDLTGSTTRQSPPQFPESLLP